MPRDTRSITPRGPHQRSCTNLVGDIDRRTGRQHHIQKRKVPFFDETLHGKPLLVRIHRPIPNETADRFSVARPHCGQQGTSRL
jgi:hypothetical protein